MFFPKEFIESLKNKVRVSDVVGRDVSLKQKAADKYLGLCPFHNEKTPSFTVSDDKGFYHCFGCGAHGNAISFLMEHRGYSFPEAIKELADITGTELPKQDKQAQEAYKKKQVKIDNSYEVMELVTSFFENNLAKNEGMVAREYIERRGINKRVAKKFRLGFALDGWEDLKNYLKGKNVSEEMMLENGLITKNEDKFRTYDRFRNRLIFPIFDSRDRVIAFGGRVLNNDEKGAKYLNSPETELFKKSYVLYGYNFARDAGYQKGQAVVVEGYMDVIMMHQAGFNNTVAPLGTAVTENHLFHLWKMAKEPTFCLDGDEAGLRAGRRVAEEFIKFLKPGYSMKFAFLTNYKDPDEVIKQKGAAEMEDILNKAIPLSQAIWNFNFDVNQTSTPEKKAELSNNLQQVANKIQHEEVRNFYRQDFNNKIREAFSNVVSFDKFRKNRSGKYGNKYDDGPIQASAELKLKASIKQDAAELLKEKLLIIISKFPKLLELSDVEDFLYTFETNNKKLETLAKLIIDTAENSSFAGEDSPTEEVNISLESGDNSNNQITPNIKELLKNIKSGADAVTAWQYFHAEYRLIVLKKRLNVLSADKESDINILLSLQGEIKEITDLRTHYLSKYNELVNFD